MRDAEAIRRCRHGEVDAFGHLVQGYQRRALAHARALTGNDADAADAAQSAFLDAFRNLGRFDETREFYPWFYVLLRNRCFKQMALRQRHTDQSDFETAAPTVASLEETYDFRAALDRLDIDDREILVLKHCDGWTYDELAARLDIPRGTVMSRLFYARRRLKILMSEPQKAPRSRSTAIIAVTVVSVVLAESKLWAYSYHYRDLHWSAQGLLLDERGRLAGHRVYRDRFDRSAIFVARLIGIDLRHTEDHAEFLERSQPGDFLLVSTPPKQHGNVLEIVRSNGGNWLLVRRREESSRPCCGSSNATVNRFAAERGPRATRRSTFW
jgi:RNA polymerase sigma-70 factor (ECF subfamily)